MSNSMKSGAQSEVQRKVPKKALKALTHLKRTYEKSNPQRLNAFSKKDNGSEQNKDNNTQYKKQ